MTNSQSVILDDTIPSKVVAIALFKIAASNGNFGFNALIRYHSNNPGLRGCCNHIMVTYGPNAEAIRLEGSQRVFVDKAISDLDNLRWNNVVQARNLAKMQRKQARKYPIKA